MSITGRCIYAVFAQKRPGRDRATEVPRRMTVVVGRSRAAVTPAVLSQPIAVAPPDGNAKLAAAADAAAAAAAPVVVAATNDGGNENEAEPTAVVEGGESAAKKPRVDAPPAVARGGGGGWRRGSRGGGEGLPAMQAVDIYAYGDTTLREIFETVVASNEAVARVLLGALTTRSDGRGIGRRGGPSAVEFVHVYPNRERRPVMETLGTIEVRNPERRAAINQLTIADLARQYEFGFGDLLVICPSRD